jgi:hypothetical protein
MSERSLTVTSWLKHATSYANDREDSPTGLMPLILGKVHDSSALHDIVVANLM